MCERTFENLKAEYQSTKDYRPSWPFVKAEWQQMALATDTKRLSNYDQASTVKLDRETPVKSYSCASQMRAISFHQGRKLS